MRFIEKIYICSRGREFGHTQNSWCTPRSKLLSPGSKCKISRCINSWSPCDIAFAYIWFIYVKESSERTLKDIKYRSGWPMFWLLQCFVRCGQVTSFVIKFSHSFSLRCRKLPFPCLALNRLTSLWLSFQVFAFVMEWFCGDLNAIFSPSKHRCTMFLQYKLHLLWQWYL